MAYKNVHFRLNSGYMTEHENRDAFFNNITSLFSSAGWDVKKDDRIGRCPEVFKGKNRLYIHPQSASGEVAEGIIPEVEDILSKGVAFKHYHTDVYETLYDMTDEEYRSWLESKKEFIKQDLLSAFITKRKNLYISNTGAVVEKVKEKYHIPRLSKHLCRSSSDIEWGYVATVLEELKVSGAFETAQTKHGTGYRTKAA